MDNPSTQTPAPRTLSLKDAKVGVVMPIAIGVSFGLWIAIAYAAPPIEAMIDPAARMVFAIKCAAVSLTFTLLLGVEAVAHERFQTDAFDPLTAKGSERLAVNQRFLQNTVEQALLFVPALLAFAAYCRDGIEMRRVLATAVVWTLARVVFWIGYHRGSQHRVAGLTGVAMTMLILLYVTARFGYELGGPVGAAALLALFGFAEVVLVRSTRRQTS